MPEALPRTLLSLVDRIGADAVDRLWLFPPLVRGRREWGLVCASCYGTARDDEERRLLVAVRYEAERTGRGLEIRSSFEEHGEAPPGHITRVMAGVVQRSDEALGDPRTVEIEGRPEALEELLGEFDSELLTDESPSGSREP